MGVPEADMDSLSSIYDYRRLVMKLRIIDIMNKPNASEYIQIHLSSEFRNLPLDQQVYHSQIALDLADLPYCAITAEKFIDIDDNIKEPPTLYIIKHKK